MVTLLILHCWHHTQVFKSCLDAVLCGLLWEERQEQMNPEVPVSLNHSDSTSLASGCLSATAETFLQPVPRCIGSYISHSHLTAHSNVVIHRCNKCMSAVYKQKTVFLSASCRGQLNTTEGPEYSNHHPNVSAPVYRTSGWIWRKMAWYSLPREAVGVTNPGGVEVKGRCRTEWHHLEQSQAGVYDWTGWSY